MRKTNGLFWRVYWVGDPIVLSGNLCLSVHGIVYEACTTSTPFVDGSCMSCHSKQHMNIVRLYMTMYDVNSKMEDRCRMPAPPCHPDVLAGFGGSGGLYLCPAPRRSIKPSSAIAPRPRAAPPRPVETVTVNLVVSERSRVHHRDSGARVLLSVYTVRQCNFVLVACHVS